MKHKQPRVAFVCFIQAGESGPIKIGFADNPIARMASLQTGHYQELRLLWATGGKTEGYEQHLHSRYALDRIRGEWFRPSPALLGNIAARIIKSERSKEQHERRRDPHA